MKTNLPVIIAEAMLIHGNSAPSHSETVLQNIYESAGYSGKALFDSKFLNLFLDTYRKIQSEFYLPKVKPGYVRIVHSTGLRIEANYGEEIVPLIQAIINVGIFPQPKTTGKHSEDPNSVFALIDFPQGEWTGNRLYNKEYPWITADIPETPRLAALYEGAVIAMPNIESEYIVGVNGLPKSIWNKL